MITVRTLAAELTSGAPSTGVASKVAGAVTVRLVPREEEEA
jgi:formaldehyde-activating enzyme involved in methanogenesis